VSACHAEGRGFEPRRSRHFLPENGSYFMAARRWRHLAVAPRWLGLPPANSSRKSPVFKNGSQLCALFPLPSFLRRKVANFPVFLRRIFR